MILKKVHIRAFKSIYELTLPLDPRINVLIGANESGKTNVLKAIEAIKTSRIFDSSLTCQYSNHYYMGKSPELTYEFGDLTKENVRQLVKISEIFKDVQTLQIRREGPTMKDYRLVIGDSEIDSFDFKQLAPVLPSILYFSEIPLLKNKIEYEHLQANGLAFETERNLLRIGGIEDYELIFEDSTRGRRAAEEASRIITEQVRRVWSQEPTLEIKLNVNGRVLYIDFSDSTTVFDTPESRSLGFRWYLSFYVNFITQTFGGKNNEFIFLIDEPGIHLHPGGQKDLVKVLEDLAQKNQVIYTTHSPFLINREHPERVLLVHKDKSGTKVDTHAYRENWKPLRKQIDLVPGDMFFFNNPSLVLELPSKKKKKLVPKFRFDDNS